MKASAETKTIREVVFHMSHTEALALSDALLEASGALRFRMSAVATDSMLWHAMNAAQTQLEVLHSALGVALAEVAK